MTDASRVAFAVAAVFAVLDWLAVAQRRKPLEYIAKPAVMAALIVAVMWFEITVVSITPVGVTEGPRRSVFVAALAFSLLGDVFLMLPRDRFLLGVAAFFAAHLAYIVGLRMDESSATTLLIGVLAVAAFALTIGRRIVLAVREKAPEFSTPVSAYVAVISVMVVSAIATRNVYAAAGAIVFMASDTLIAWNRFVQPLAWAPVTIMVTYHVGQAALVLSLVRG